MKTFKLLILLIFSLTSTSLFASEAIISSCQDSDYKRYKSLRESGILNEYLVAVTDAVDKICERNPMAQFSIKVEAPTPKSDPNKTKATLKLDGSYRKDTKDGDYLLVSTDLSVSKIINKTNRTSLSGSGEVRKTEGELYTKVMLAAQRDKLLFDGNDDTVIFAVIKTNHDEAKNYKIIATGLIGIGYDFMGDYFGINDGGTAIKLSTALGGEHSNYSDEKDDDKEFVSSTRLKIIQKVTDSVKVTFVSWFKTGLYSKEKSSTNLSDYETNEELTIEFKLNAIAKYFDIGSETSLYFKVFHNYTNEPAGDDIDKNDYGIMTGIKLDWK